MSKIGYSFESYARKQKKMFFAQCYCTCDADVIQLAQHFCFAFSTFCRSFCEQVLCWGI